jgi:hypothetical protein
MKKIILERPVEVKTIYLDCISEKTPIFVKDKEGKLAGMMVQENNKWIVKTGGVFGATGLHSSRSECIKSCEIYGYSFFVEE